MVCSVPIWRRTRHSLSSWACSLLGHTQVNRQLEQESIFVPRDFRIGRRTCDLYVDMPVAVSWACIICYCEPLESGIQLLLKKLTLNNSQNSCGPFFPYSHFWAFIPPVLSPGIPSSPFYLLKSYLPSKDWLDCCLLLQKQWITPCFAVLSYKTHHTVSGTRVGCLYICLHREAVGAEAA